MNKKILSAILAVTLLVPVTANAAQLRNTTVAQPTIAILDTAIDTSIPALKDRIIYEACLTQWATCPNGMKQMEGTNSAILPMNQLTKNGFDHGTQMASLAVATNPNVNIVFVRIIGINRIGLRQASGEETTYVALDWVLQNKDKFNIQAVSFSQGHSMLGAAGTDYCPKTPITEAKINQLMDAGVPVFVAAGNVGDIQRINWPACIPSAVAIGATMPTKSIAFYSNYDAKLIDFFAQGTTRTTTAGNKLINVAGTSASTVIAATQWATIKSAYPTYTYSQIYDLISRTSTPTSNSKITGGKLINLEAALRG